MVLHAVISTNVLLEQITVIMPQNAQTLLVVSLVLVILDTEVMVLHVLQLTFVRKELTTAIPMPNVPSPLAVLHVLVILATKVMA